jgi:hypothetical protein
MTLAETGVPLGLTQERIRQIEAEALYKLRLLVREHRNRYPYPDHFDVAFPEEVYTGPTYVPVAEPPEGPLPVVRRVQKPEAPEPMVDFEALALLLES